MIYLSLMQARHIKQEATQALVKYRTDTAKLTDQSVSDFSNCAVSRFFEYFTVTGSPLRESIELLCEINASPNPAHKSIGLEALFTNLIEKLNDAFLPTYCDLYDRVFTQVISFFRQLPEGRTIDTALNEFELHSEASILRRKHNLNRRQNQSLASRSLKKLLFLSRVTIGADVAITSVVMAHLKQRFPEAEFILIGSLKLQQLYGGDSQIRVKPIDYGRRGDLISRLETWLQIKQVVEDELEGLDPNEFCVVDPDSRLTQLGLFPLLNKEIEDQNYYFFPSRSYTARNSQKLGQLAAHWIAGLCDHKQTSYPFIALPLEQLEITRKVFSDEHDTRFQPTICLSFGVGGNMNKRVSQEFETDLVTALSERARLIIDCGASDEEYEQVQKLLSILAAKGKTIGSINNSQTLSQMPHQIPDVITWQGSLGTFASLIAVSNLYIGYDSAGQHIAAALNIPTLTIFVNSGSNNFPDRWQPYGAGTIKTIHLNRSQSNSEILVPPNFLSQVLEVQEQLLMCCSPVEKPVENCVENL